MNGDLSGLVREMGPIYMDFLGLVVGDREGHRPRGNCEEEHHERAREADAQGDGRIVAAQELREPEVLPEMGAFALGGTIRTAGSIRRIGTGGRNGSIGRLGFAGIPGGAPTLQGVGDAVEDAGHRGGGVPTGGSIGRRIGCAGAGGVRGIRSA